MTPEAEGRPSEDTRAADTSQRNDVATTLGAASDSPPQPAGRFVWERALRKASDLDATAKLVGYAVSTWATTETGADARPGSKKLQLATSKSEATVQRGLQRLRQAGWLLVTNEAERRTDRYRAWEYQLTIPSSALPITGDTKSPRQHAPVTGAYPSPVQGLPITGDRSQAQDQIITSTAARERLDASGEALPADQAAAARRLFERHAPAITEADATDCIRHLACRKRPPDNFGAYTRGFDVDAVRESAERYRTGPAATPPARGAAKCPHGVAGGLLISGTGGQASRVCGACESADPADRHLEAVSGA